MGKIEGTIIDELIVNHNDIIISDITVKKFIYYISNNYPFIHYKELDFTLDYTDCKIMTVEMNNNYTRYVLTADKTEVLRKHKINNLLKRDILKEFE